MWSRRLDPKTRRVAVAAALILLVAGAFAILKRDRAFRVASGDGRLELSFTKGHLPDGLKPSALSVAAVDSAESGDRLVGYDLRPSGATFARPIVAVFRRNVPAGRSEAAAPAVFHLSGDGRLELVDGVVTEYDLESGILTTTFALTRFSRVYVVEEALMRVAARPPAPAPVGRKVRLEAVVTPRYGESEVPPDWGGPPTFTPEQVAKHPELEQVQRELNVESDWIRRMRTFYVPGQGLLSMATADYAGTLAETGGRLLSPAKVADRPSKGIVTAPLDDSEVLETEYSYDDFACVKEGRTRVSWSFRYDGFSHRGDPEGETVIASGEFRLVLPVTCVSAAETGDEEDLEYVEIEPPSLTVPVVPQRIRY